MTPAEQLKEQVLALQNALLNAHPQMTTLLKTIHSQLKADPSLVTVLEEDDIAIVVSGLSKLQQTIIATSVAKTGTKSMKNITVGDL